MNSQDPSLFPEDALRQHLQGVADEAPDLAFEAAVLGRIRRRKQIPALALAGAAILVIVLWALYALWTAVSLVLPGFFPEVIPFFTRDVPHFANTALVWIAYAPSLAEASWQQLRPLLFLALTAAFSVIFVLEISICLILNNRKIRL